MGACVGAGQSVCELRRIHVRACVRAWLHACLRVRVFLSLALPLLRVWVGLTLAHASTSSIFSWYCMISCLSVLYFSINRVVVLTT